LRKIIDQNYTDLFNTCVEKDNQDMGEEVKMEKSVEDMGAY